MNFNRDRDIALGRPLADGLWLLLLAGAVGAQVYWMAHCVKRARHYNI